MRRRPEPPRSPRWLARLFLGVVAAIVVGSAAQAQSGVDATPDVLVRGLELEQSGKFREAAAAYRRALATPGAVSAMLGLERVLIELGQGDTVLAIVDSVIRVHPRNPTY